MLRIIPGEGRVNRLEGFIRMLALTDVRDGDTGRRSLWNSGVWVCRRAHEDGERST